MMHVRNFIYTDSNISKWNHALLQGSIATPSVVKHIS